MKQSSYKFIMGVKIMTLSFQFIELALWSLFYSEGRKFVPNKNGNVEMQCK